MFVQVGKLLLIAGAVLAACGATMLLLHRLGVSRLPGDVSFGGRNWRVFLPIGTSIVLSLILMLILWVISRVRR